MAKEDEHAELDFLFFRVVCFAEGKVATLVKTLHKGWKNLPRFNRNPAVGVYIRQIYRDLLY